MGEIYTIKAKGAFMNIAVVLIHRTCKLDSRLHAWLPSITYGFSIDTPPYPTQHIHTLFHIYSQFTHASLYQSIFHILICSMQLSFLYVEKNIKKNNFFNELISSRIES